MPSFLAECEEAEFYATMSTAGNSLCAVFKVHQLREALIAFDQRSEKMGP